MLVNPYWKAIQRHVSRSGTLYETEHLQQWRLCNQYSWAIPDPASVEFVATYLAPRAVEIGAGTGYWTWMMAQMGIDIVAYDIAPPDSVSTNKWHSPWDARSGRFLGQLRETFAPVALGGPEKLVLHADRTLFLCWPPYRNGMAMRCLTDYAGSRLVYIGEGDGGNCATAAFFKHLEKDWCLVASHTPVHWYRMGDNIAVYERIGGAPLQAGKRQMSTKRPRRVTGGKRRARGEFGGADMRATAPF